MSKRRLSEKQIAAIEFLSLPNRGGLTYEQIAEEVGVSSVSLRKWRKDDTFNDELKRQVVRNTIDRLPDIMASIPDHIIKDGNAAMLRTLLQTHGMLTDKVEVETKGNNDGDVDAMRAEIEAFRNKGK